MGRDRACSPKAARHSALPTWREVGAPAPHWEQCYDAFAKWPDSGFPRPPRPMPPQNHFKFDPRWSVHPRGIGHEQLGARSQCLASSPAGATPQSAVNLCLAAASKLVLLGDSYTELHWIALACAMGADLRLASRMKGSFAGTTARGRRLTIPYICVPVANRSLCLLSHKGSPLQAEERSNDAVASLGSIVAIGRGSGWLTAKDTVIVNAGLHYPLSKLEPAVLELLDANRVTTGAAAPWLIWRETSAQSFPTPSGEYIANSSSAGVNCTQPPEGRGPFNKITTPMMEAACVPIIRYEQASKECWQEVYGPRDTRLRGASWGQPVPGQRHTVVLDCTHTAPPSGLLDWLSAETLRQLSH